MSQEQIPRCHPMKKISVEKIVVNIGVGKSGDPLEKAKHALQELTGKKPSVRGARKSVRDFGIHKGEPIGTMVTLRRESAVKFLKSVLEAKGNTMKALSFDEHGNISIGIHEHIDIPGTRYNPEIGIFGMDVSVVLTRPGYRIAKKRENSSIGKKHRITKKEAVEFFQQQYGAELV
ncbi:MAG TPA: 50S ribosomal protein L5 [Nitrososphaeraceae archaeon]|nr:50S ribosomal protein L5 [Nitrososphaeraceae archaeon]